MVVQAAMAPVRQTMDACAGFNFLLHILPEAGPEKVAVYRLRGGFDVYIKGRQPPLRLELPNNDFPVGFHETLRCLLLQGLHQIRCKPGPIEPEMVKFLGIHQPPDSGGLEGKKYKTFHSYR